MVFNFYLLLIAEDLFKEAEAEAEAEVAAEAEVEAEADEEADLSERYDALELAEEFGPSGDLFLATGDHDPQGEKSESDRSNVVKIPIVAKRLEDVDEEGEDDSYIDDRDPLQETVASSVGDPLRSTLAGAGVSDPAFALTVSTSPRFLIFLLFSFLLSSPLLSSNLLFYSILSTEDLSYLSSIPPILFRLISAYSYHTLSILFPFLSSCSRPRNTSHFPSTP